MTRYFCTVYCIVLIRRFMFYCKILYQNGKNDNFSIGEKNGEDNIAGMQLIDILSATLLLLLVSLIKSDYFSSSFVDFCDDVDVDPVLGPLVARVRPVLPANFSSNSDFCSCR